MPSAPRMTQPLEMKTKHYVYGVKSLNGNDAWSLFEASALGDAPKAKTLLTKDPRLINAQFWYQFPIHLAVYAGHTEIVKLLLSHGANPGQSIYTYNSWDKLLRCATERGYHRIESLLQRAMHKRFNYTPDFDPLKAAIQARDPRKINAILRRRPDLARASDALGNNPLHWSVITRQLNLIGRFVESGTPIDAQRADGQTPVLLAVNGATDYWYRATRDKSHPSLRNTSVIVGSLLAHGANYTLSVAAAIGDQERAETLLRKDPDLAKHLDSSRVSPLTHAAREGQLHIVRLLLEHGADPNLPEGAAPRGQALYEACCRNHLEIAKLLLEHGADPNAGVDSCECCITIGKVYHGDQAQPLQQLLRQHGAYTPPYAMTRQEIKQAIRASHEVVRHPEFSGNVLRTHDLPLLELYLGSEPSALDHLDFKSILSWPKSSELVRKLLARGLNPNQTDWLGKSLLHTCAETGTKSVSAILLDAGADINAREVEFQGTPLAAAVRTVCTTDDPKHAANVRQTLELLLKRGAKPNLPDDKPWATPVAWATRHNRSDLMEILTAAT
jgi:ankyrin repeat protein